MKHFTFLLVCSFILILGCNGERSKDERADKEEIAVKEYPKVDLDSLMFVVHAKKLLNIIQQPTDELLGLLSDSIHCVECFDISSLEDPATFTEKLYLFEKSVFVNEHIEIIKDIALKALDSDGQAHVNKNQGAIESALVLFNVYGPNELAEGHEGLQLGLGFEKIEDEFKLSSIETIP